MERADSSSTWRIDVDGATVCVGRVLPAAPPLLTGAGASRFVATAWGRALTAQLRDPASALCGEVLSFVFARLPLLDRLRCARVCRGWRNALRPSEHAWQTIDLGADAFPRSSGSYPLDFQLRRVVLPRYGANLRELRLRGTDVTDENLTSVVAACPALALLDVRDCGAALRYDCERVLPSGPLMELLLRLYARAAPGDTFTLLMEGAGHTECLSCGYFCNNSGRLVASELTVASSWLVKRGAGEPMADAQGMHEQQPWLRSDVAVCPLYEFNNGDGCSWLIDDSCDCVVCGRMVCDTCVYVHTCAGPEQLQFCAECFSGLNFNVKCAAPRCTHEVCEDCIERCSVPGCKAAVCDVCAYNTPALLSRCDDCGAVACWRHTYICNDCQPEDTPRLLRDRLGFDFRAMMKCCTCKRTYCSQCDPSPDGGGCAGDIIYEDCDSGCVHCVGFPRFCGGRATELRDACAEDVEDAEEAAQEAEALAASERAKATHAAIAAQAAADHAAHLLKAAEAAEARAQKAQHELTCAREALREAEDDIVL